MPGLRAELPAAARWLEASPRTANNSMNGDGAPTVGSGERHSELLGSPGAETPLRGRVVPSHPDRGSWEHHPPLPLAQTWGRSCSRQCRAVVGRSLSPRRRTASARATRRSGKGNEWHFVTNAIPHAGEMGRKGPGRGSITVARWRGEPPSSAAAREVPGSAAASGSQGVLRSAGEHRLPRGEAALRLRQGALPRSGEEPGAAGAAAGLDEEPSPNCLTQRAERSCEPAANGGGGFLAFRGL